MEFCLKWVHMARYELILGLDGALWLTIISKNPDPRRAMEGPTNPKESKTCKCKGQDAPPLHCPFPLRTCVDGLFRDGY